MPDLELHCASGWMPGGSGNSMHRLFTTGFGASLAKSSLPTVFLEVWGEELASDKVHLIYIPQDIGNTNIANIPDIRVVIRPLFSSSRASQLIPMLVALESSLTDLRDRVANGLPATKPRIKFEINFKFGGGGALGDPTESWHSELPAIYVYAD